MQGVIPRAIRAGVPSALPGSSSSTLLLDTYPGAVAAYSLRKLRSAYSDAAIRVRRSSDNAEEDIGFDSNGDLDTSALLAHVGAGDGFVTTWYDQGESGNDLTQSFASYQSVIVDSGSVTQVGARPAFYSPTTAQRLTGSISLTQPNHYFVTASLMTGGDGVDWLTDHTGVGDRQLIRVNYGNWELWAGSAIGSTTASPGQHIISGLFNGASSQMHVDGSLVASGNPGSNGLGSLAIPAPTNNAWRDYVQELIVYDSDQSANRDSIESDINTYYTVY